jgi:hypothetical protein
MLHLQTLIGKLFMVKLNLEKSFDMKKYALLFALFTAVSIVATSQPQLTWRFANAEVINAGTQFQFDVEVKADAAGTYHRDLQVYFDYSTPGFGTDIVASGKVSVAPLALMNTHYFVVNTADNTSSKFAIITEATHEMTQPGSAAHYNAVPTTFTGLLRFTIDIADNTQPAGIAFDAALMDGGQYYQSTVSTDPLKYAIASVYDNDLNSLLLSTLYGTITYANAINTPLADCSVQVGALGVAISDANGLYQYTGLSDGPYTLTTTSSLPYTYTTNLADVNVVVSHLMGTPLVGIYYLAAEVTGDDIVTLSDANVMVSNILGVQSGYPAVPAWKFGVEDAIVIGGIGTKSFQGIQAGDATGSWQP